MRLAARDGKLRVWGRRRLAYPLPPPAVEFRELEEEIPADHWHLARLSRNCTLPAVASICRTEVEAGAAAVAEVPVYGYLRVNRRQVERLWPETGTFRGTDG